MKIFAKFLVFLAIIVYSIFQIGCSHDEEGMITTKTGLKYKDLVVGTGVEAVKGKNVWVHYIAMLENGKKFEDSYEVNQPLVWQLGVGGIGQAIPGFDEGVKGMKVGGKRKLIIPPKLAFGEVGFPVNAPDSLIVVPPNSTIIYIVELLDVKDL